MPARDVWRARGCTAACVILIALGTAEASRECTTGAPTQPYASTHGGADTLKCNVFRHNSGSDADVGSAASDGARAGEHTCSALSARHTSLLERGPDGEDLLRGEDRKPQL